MVPNERIQIAPRLIGTCEADVNASIDGDDERPKGTLSGLPTSMDSSLPGNVRGFAAKHRLTASVAVATQTIKRVFPSLSIEISLKSDSETGETVISFTAIPPAGQDLAELSETNSRLHDEIFNSLPTKSLQFFSFGFRFA
jgi:hypothetical protein